MTFRLRDLVGRYGLVVSDELLVFIERAFVDPAPPDQQAAIRAEAVHEAAGAELEITTGGCLVSRSHAQEFYRVSLDLDDREYEEVRFEKGPSAPVWLRLVDSDTILARQPGKPVAVFRRK